MCYWKKKQEGFRSSVKSGRPFCEKVFFQCSTPPRSRRTHTHARVHGPPTHTRTRRATRLPWVLGSIFSGPLRDPSVVTDTDAAPHRPATPSSYTAPSGRSFCLLPARRGAEDHQPCVRASVCVCECTCASDERGAAGRPCSHTGSVDGSSSVLRWSSYSVYALRATYLYYTRRTYDGAVLAQSCVLVY